MKCLIDNTKEEEAYYILCFTEVKRWLIKYNN